MSDPAGFAAGLLALGADVLSFHRADAETAATLWPAGRARGLSLGDRACLATAKAAPAGYAATADTTWTDVDVGVEIRVIHNQ